MANNFLDKNGLLYLWQKITNKFVAKESGKGLSTNDFTTELKTKLDAIEAGAQKNVKPDWNAVSGTAGEILNKPTIPTRTSQLQNDSNFITVEQVPEGAVASNTVPKMDSATGSVGTETEFARGDHVHPSDSTKADKDHNHDDVYLKLSGGQMTGPIQFSSDQGGFEVQGSNVETKVQMTETGTEILFDDNQNNLRNRVTVSNTGVAMVAGATLADGEETPGTGVTVTIDKDNGVKIPMVATPTTDRDAANKKYVDDKSATKADKATTLAGYGITDAYTKTELDGKLSSTYKPGGSSDFASLPTLDAAHSGMVYSMTEGFTTDERFIEGAGKQYPIGTNVAVIQVMVEDTPEYKFDVLAGFVDLSGYMQKTDMVAITNEEIDQIVGDSAA